MKMLTTGQAANICGVGVNTIKNWIKNGYISAVQLPSGHWRIPAGECERLLAEAGKSAVAGKKEVRSTDSIGERPRVLVVDDDPHMHSYITDACAVSGIDTELGFASDGYDGLIEIGRFRPHLLVLDIMMPKINGLELIQRIKNDTDKSSMAILVITGAQERRLVMHRLDRAGPDAILHKPLEMHLLIETMTGLLGQICTEVKSHHG